MRILIAEDDAISRRVLERMLEKWGHEVIVAKNGVEALEIFNAANPPPLAILDWMMPEKDGVEVCAQIRLNQQDLYTYIIMLTSKNQAEDVIAALDRGADDYIIKPFNATELRARVQAGLRIVELQRELVQAQEQLHEQATTDDLTKAYNHKTILDMLEKEFVRANRNGDSLSLIMFDIDHFKNVNDTLGHQAGDAVLAEVAERMRHATRIYDGFGRLGGEEFLIIATECDESKAMSVAERLREAVAQTPICWEEEEISLTVSLGVAVASGDPNETSNALVRRADQAMYSAKDAGRNCVQIAVSKAPSKPKDASP